MDLKGKTVLVTGASSGIGQAIAIECAKEEAHVCIAYFKNKDGAKQTLHEVEKYSKGYIFKADLTKWSDINNLFLEIRSRVGDLDILINNAGDAKPSDFFDNAMWKDQMDNIFFSAVYTSQQFLNQNIKSEPRKILNITSIAASPKASDPTYFAYSAAKAALASMTVSLAKMNPKVLVNAIAPGYTWTKPWEAASEEDKKYCLSETIINRFINVDEIAKMVVAVLKNDAMTGQTVVVDGGLLVK